MKTKFTFLIGVLSIFSAATLSARTASFNFNQDFTSPVELWAALPESPTLGTWSQSPYATGPNSGAYCNVIVLNAGTYDVTLKITTNYFELYPQYTSGNTNLQLNGVNLVVEEGASFAGANAEIHIRNGAALHFNGGGSFGGLTLDTGKGNAVFANGITFNNSSGSTLIGSTSATAEQRVTILGSSSDITFRNLKFYGAAGTSADDIKGGAIEFVADANGVSTLKTYGISGNPGSFDGVLIVDFTSLDWDQAWGDSKTFTLVSTTENNMADAFAAWALNADTLGKVIGDVDASFTADARNIYVTISEIVIPEASTYAAIFGALALGLAAYRKRR